MAQTTARGLRVLLLASALLTLAPPLRAQPAAKPSAPLPSADDQRLLAALGRSEGLMKQGRFEDALAEMERTIAAQIPASAPYLSRLHLQRGVVLVLLDQGGQARTSFNLALCYDGAADPRALDSSPTVLKVFAEARRSLSCAGIPSPAERRASAAAPSKGGGEKEQSTGLRTALLIGGGALVATGAVLGVLALDAESDVENTPQVDAAEARDKADNLALATDVTLALGIAAAGTGLVLLLTEDDPAPTAAPATSWIPLGPGGGPGFSLSLSF